jgi:glutathione reductase (NADPH)
MPAYDYDLFVIGGGSGGVRAARIAAGHGARVAIAEEYRYGGTCVIRGCVPKKLFVYASQFHDAFADAGGYGWDVGYARFSWPRLLAGKDAEIARLEGIYRKVLLEKGVTVMDGRAVLTDAHTVVMGGKRFSADKVLIATGGRPVLPEIPGAEFCFTSNEAFHLPQLPKRLVILGGGFIACEFAGIFHGLGVAVTLAYRGDQVLRGFDDDVRGHLGQAMQSRGLDLRLNATPVAIEQVGGGYVVRLQSGETLQADAVMAGTGRAPNTIDLGLDAAGVEIDSHGAVRVDQWSQSNIANIYAVGDVTNRINLTPVAIHEGHAFADTVFGQNPRPVNHDLVAHAVFSQPGVATVGLSEAEARKRGGAVEIYRSAFRPLKATLSGRGEKDLVKLVVDAKSQKVLGCHMVGDEAAEIIQGLAVALQAGATKAQFDATLGIHPTVAEEFVQLREPVKGWGAAG